MITKDLLAATEQMSLSPERCSAVTEEYCVGTEQCSVGTKHQCGVVSIEGRCNNVSSKRTDNDKLVKKHQHHQQHINLSRT